MKKNLLILTAALFMGIFTLNTVSAQQVESSVDDYIIDLDMEGKHDKKKTNTSEVVLEPVLAATPNPTTGNIMKIWYNNLVGVSQVRVTDANGRVVYAQAVDGRREKEGLLEVSTRNMARGLYFISLNLLVFCIFSQVRA